MPYKNDYELGGLQRFTEPAVIEGFEELESFRQRRAEIALRLARYTVEACNGETTDLRLYYGAMFGKSYEEGVYENDPNLQVPQEIMRRLSEAAQQGQPLFIQSASHPNTQPSVGVVGSFSTETFEPVKFEVEIEQDIDGFASWRGGLAIAMRKVRPIRAEDRAAGSQDYELANEVSKIAVHDTATWLDTPSGGLAVHPEHRTGGVVVGENVHKNYVMNRKYDYYGQQRHWLAQHLAPTERKPLDDSLLRIRDTLREFRRKSAERQGICEAKVAAWGLSPTIATFFELTKPYAEGDEFTVIDTKELFQKWHDAYDAQELLAEIEVRELVELNSDGQLVVSSLGREALTYLHENDY